MVEYSFGTCEGIAPEGTYKFIINSADERFSRVGNPMIVLDCSIVSEKEFEPVRYYIVFSPRTEKMVRRDLAALGFKVPGDGSPFQFNEPPSSFANRQFKGGIKHEDYDGKTQAKIAWLSKLGEGEHVEFGEEKVEIPF